MVLAFLRTAVDIHHSHQKRIEYHYDHYHEISPGKLVKQACKLLIVDYSGVKDYVCTYSWKQQQYIPKQGPSPALSYLEKKSCHAFGMATSVQYLNLLEICKILLSVYCWSNEDFLELLLTSTGRDRVSADNVLLKTLESVDTTTDSRLAEHLGSLLE